MVGTVTSLIFVSLFYLNSYAGVTYKCDGAELTQQSAATWAFRIDDSDEGRNAREVILKSANAKAIQAHESENPMNRDFPWMKQNEYFFPMSTMDGAEIQSIDDFFAGRRISTRYANNLFWTSVRVFENDNSLRFRLLNIMDTFVSSVGGTFSCAIANDGVRECVVQEYVFRNCELQ